MLLLRSCEEQPELPARRSHDHARRPTAAARQRFRLLPGRYCRPRHRGGAHGAVGVAGAFGGPMAAARPPHHRDGAIRDGRHVHSAGVLLPAVRDRLQLCVLRVLRVPAAASGVATTATATAATESAAAAAASTTTDVHLRRRPAARHGAVPAVSKRHVPHNRRVQRNMHPTAAAILQVCQRRSDPDRFRVSALRRHRPERHQLAVLQQHLRRAAAAATRLQVRRRSTAGYEALPGLRPERPRCHVARQMLPDVRASRDSAADLAPHPASP